MSSSGYGSSTPNNADDFVAYRTPAVIDFVFENVNTFYDKGARVVYDLLFTEKLVEVVKD